MHIRLQYFSLHFSLFALRFARSTRPRVHLVVHRLLQLLTQIVLPIHQVDAESSTRVVLREDQQRLRDELPTVVSVLIHAQRRTWRNDSPSPGELGETRISPSGRFVGQSSRSDDGELQLFTGV